MENLTAYNILFAFCGLIILSYLFSVLNRLTRIPSVLMLLGTGILLRYAADSAGLSYEVPPTLIEFLGTVGLIMIVLEAGLDLEITRDKLPMIRSSFVSALVVLVLSILGVAGILRWWMPEVSVLQCVVYGIPLSIVSSAIVLPSVHHLGHEKKEFLIYEASFSDVLGIMAFNFFTAEKELGWGEVSWFIGSIPVSLVLSVGVCFGLMLLLVRNRINIKFFLAFAVLIVIYVGGKMMHLPSLITIMAFGLVVNNWELIRWKPLKNYFSDESVDEAAGFLKSITAESAFLIRTFFFVIFGGSVRRRSRRATLSRMRGMKLWPPKPGFTLMSSTKSKSPTRSTRVSTGVPGFSTMPAWAPALRMASRVRWAWGSAFWWMLTQLAPAFTKSTA